MLGIEYIRNQLGLNISDLAKLLSVSRQIVSKWEKGEKKIPDKRLDELAVIFNIPKKYFDKELDFSDKINITSLINREKMEGMCEEVESGIFEEILNAIKNDDIEKIQNICLENKEGYIEFINYCKEKITVSQRKLIMNISICENKAKNNNVHDLKNIYYFSQLYSDMAEKILQDESKIKIIANVLNEIIKESSNDK